MMTSAGFCDDFSATLTEASAVVVAVATAAGYGLDPKELCSLADRVTVFQGCAVWAWSIW